jgi:lysophospholipase L1-like esterase
MRFSAACRQALRFFALAFVAIVLTGCGEEGQRLPRLASDAKILAFGDSLTYGTGAGGQESYPTVLQGLTKRIVINAGVPGETTAAALVRLPGLLDDADADLVILCLGGNDFLRRIEPAETVANLSRMIEIIRARNLPVVLVAVPTPGLFLSGDALYTDLAKKYGVPLENDVLADVLGEKSLKSDQIHPNAAGYRKVAEALAKLLKNSGAV